MATKSNKIAEQWIRETRSDFRAFLDETDFPDPERLGERGPKFKYPEWLIMFVAILSAKHGQDADWQDDDQIHAKIDVNY